MLFAVLIVVISVLAVLAVWASGLIGRRGILTPPEARAKLTELLGEIGATAHLSVPAGLVPVDVAARTSLTTDRGEQHSDTRSAPSATWVDGAVPAGIATAAGLHEWLTPDSEALAAFAHVTGQEVDNALDFHSIVAGKELTGDGYQFLTDGSMSNWMGHVGEQQIGEQIAGWVGDDVVSMPDSASFEGADINIFGEDFQVKFYKDFDDIVNQHGDALIVNSDAVNIPDDALWVDFSEPFDPAILEGHDVVVAEGLTRVGAIDSWESAAGVWAGGMDGGDVAGEIFDAAIPGVGAAVVVVMQGYRRRKALADEELRIEATKRIARDSAERLAAVSTGAAIGTGIGFALDAATLGMTGGLGMLAGGVIGSWVAGRKAAKVAIARENEKIQAAHHEVLNAVSAYGLAVESAQSYVEDAWQETLDRGQLASTTLSTLLVQQRDEVLTRANDELAAALHPEPGRAAALLSDSRDAAASFARSGWGLPALRERKRWLARAALISETSETEEMLLVVLAAPGGTERVEGWLRDADERRRAAVAAAEVALRSLFRRALDGRSRLRTYLVAAREDLTASTHDSLVEPVERVARANEILRVELAVAGKA